MRSTRQRLSSASKPTTRNWLRSATKHWRRILVYTFCAIGVLVVVFDKIPRAYGVVRAGMYVCEHPARVIDLALACEERGCLGEYPLVLVDYCGYMTPSIERRALMALQGGYRDVSRLLTLDLLGLVPEPVEPVRFDQWTDPEPDPAELAAG